MENTIQVTLSKESIEKLMEVSNFDEKQRRIFYGFLCESYGHGGRKIVSDMLNVSVNTVAAGRDDFKGTKTDRVRRKGGGRKLAIDVDLTLLEDLKAIVEESAYGSPCKPLSWVNLSCRKIAEMLSEKGHDVSHTLVLRLLELLGFSRQKNQKMIQVGKKHPDRNAQFEFINNAIEESLKAGNPVISIDAKKKEKLGNMSNAGSEYRYAKDPRLTNDHDFLDRDLGMVTPYGIYVLNDNTAFVNLGTSKDTSEFAVESIFRWYNSIGKPNFPNSNELLVIGDGGGSNGSRVRLWKYMLAELCEKTGITIRVCHLPPGTSKWNKIEHRLFCYISKNWAGKPLVDVQTVVNLIGSTTTTTGLKVECVPDYNIYNTGIKITDEQMSNIDIEPIGEFPQWNYRIRGFKRSI